MKNTFLIIILLASFTLISSCKKDKSSACDIITFAVNGENWNIATGAEPVLITKIFPKGSNVSNLTPTIVVSNGATVSPKSGEAKNFSQDVQYTVTAEDGKTTKRYTAQAIVATE